VTDSTVINLVSNGCNAFKRQFKERRFCRMSVAQIQLRIAAGADHKALYRWLAAFFAQLHLSSAPYVDHVTWFVQLFGHCFSKKPIRTKPCESTGSGPKGGENQ
jgi:hypothetical protein